MLRCRADGTIAGLVVPVRDIGFFHVGSKQVDGWDIA